MSLENIKLVNEITRNFMCILENYSDNIETLTHIKDYVNTKLDTNIKKLVTVETSDGCLKERAYFINKFLCSTENIFYYVEKNDIFIYYDLNHYKIYEEDVLRSQIYNEIMQHHPNLNKYKFDIETDIINELKNDTLLNCIPESFTIQHVINFFMTYFFDVKETAKYFCCALGDFILKKNIDQVYCINREILEFLTLFEKTIANRLDNICLVESNNFVCNKILSTCSLNEHRIIYSQNNNKACLWSDFLNKHAIDIYAVCIHYSKRYLNAEKYISHHKSPEKILYFKNNTVKKMIERFSLNNFKIQPNKSITYENMEYLWYTYLKKQHIPPCINRETLHAFMELYSKHNNNVKNNSVYLCISHPDNDNITNVKRFLDEKLHYNVNEQLEISELVEIYLEYASENIQSATIFEDGNTIDEYLMSDIISYFTDFNIINDGKTIDGIRCILWDKKGELSSFIELLKTNHKNGTRGIVDNISFNEVYTKYCKYISHTGNVNKIVTKSYFINFIIKHIPEKYIIFNKISEQFWTS
jgi:hypothetical protein